MRLTRVHVARPLVADATLELPDAAGAHLVRVLRLGPGAPVVVFDGAGHEHDAQLTRIRGTRVEVTVGAPRAASREARFGIVLLQSISRGDRMDWTVQKATELGVARIVPLKTEHTIVRLDAAASERKRLHWLAVAAAACEQCGRSLLPVIDAPQTLPDYLARVRGQDGDAADIRLALDPEASAGLGALEPAAGATILVGPEGGLAAEELALVVRHGFRATRLGPRVLRTETAAIAAIAALQALQGDLAS